MSESNTKTAVITAVLTGLFTVLAGMATYWLTTKEPELTFSVVGGPTLLGPSGAKRIFVVEVHNSGRKEISQTLIQLALKSGELSEVAMEASPGVKLSDEKSQRQFEIHADMLNPGDVVKVSFLTSLAQTDSEPKVVVRAPGVLAVAETKEKDGLFRKGKTSNLWALLASASAAVLSSLFLLLPRSRLARKLGVSPSSSSIDQSEVCAYVCGACKLYEEADRLRFGGGAVSYRGAADYLRHQAAKADPADRRRYEVALQALLLHKGISPNSLAAIRTAIGAISGSAFSDETFLQLRGQAILEGDDPVTWRDKVEIYAIDQAVES